MFVGLGAVGGFTASLAFALGALLASGVWHLMLVTAGGAAAGRLGARGRAVTLIAGPALVLLLAVLAVTA